MKYYLSIVAIFKNESNILKEWLEHYLMEGVDHFYLIDNDSIDDYKSILVPYEKENVIDLRVDKRTHMQIAHYNGYYLEKIKKESEWVMIVDMDEFIYSRDQYQTISSYLRSLSSDIVQIYVPWKIYGSSGYVEQPNGCVEHFDMRTQYNHVKTNGMNSAEKILTKTIVRTNYLASMGIHCSLLRENTNREVTSDGRPITGSGNDKCFQFISEEILQKSQLHCNHYPIQSYEWFRKIKMGRGSANTEANDKVRTFKYYNSFDEHSNQVLDSELHIKRSHFKAYYGVKTYLDVTRIIYKQFMDKSMKKIVIGENVGFNTYFGDPAPGVEKYLIIKQCKKLTVYSENNHGLISINI
jgi:hypothetical protein